jgi:N-acetylmuramoyl-L-alanine amidase
VLAAVLLTAGCSSAPLSGAGTASQLLTAPHSIRPTSTPPSSPAPPSRTHHVHPSTPPTHPPTRSASSSVTSRSVPPVQPVPRMPRVSPGLTVVLNPGHNGGDAAHPEEISRLVPSGYGNVKACETTGTDTFAGYPEHAFNWDVALRVRRILIAHGVQVIMTRHSDTGVGPCVDRRAAIGNQPGVDAVVSIHADGAPSSGHGFHVNQDSRRPEGATAATAHRSIVLGRAIHAALVRSSGLVPSTYIGTNGYYYRSDLAGLNLARRPATFLELGNMKNAGDATLQSSASGRQQIAGAIAVGILAFLH